MLILGHQSEADAPAPKTDLSTISFGALARAQASLPSSKRSKKPAQPPSDDSDPHSPPERDDSKRPATKASMKRSSKHAPQEQTSKKPVSRRREVVSTETKRAPARDPRFDVTMGKMTPQEEARAKKAYAFLEKYRDDELAELKAQVKKTKDPDQKEELKRQVMVIESRRKTNKRKEERESIMREHRAKEKELVAQGKQPFYLKRAEQKKQALTKRFEGLSKGQRDKAIERKRKKVAGKEKKELDFLERRQH